jgi:hypothetical protein
MSAASGNGGGGIACPRGLSAITLAPHNRNELNRGWAIALG